MFPPEGKALTMRFDSPSPSLHPPGGGRRLATLAAAVVAGAGLLAVETESADLNEAIGAQPPYPGSSGQLVWDVLRGHFRLSFSLEPPAAAWDTVKREHPQLAGGEYKSGAYRLKISEQEAGKQTCVINYELSRADGRPFRMLENRLECKTSYSGVYKIFEPGSFSQQNYKIDRPSGSTAERAPRTASRSSGCSRPTAITR
jgi:hypothetical protein